ADVAARLGYTGIEIVATTLADNPFALKPAEVSAYANAAEAAGVRIIGLHWLLAKIDGVHLTNPEREVRQKTIEAISGLIKLTEDLGGQVVVHGSPMQRNLLPGVTYEQAFDNAVYVYDEVMKRTTGSSVAVCFEQLSAKPDGETDFVYNLAQMMNLVYAINSTRFTGHLDVKALDQQSSFDPQTAGGLIQKYADFAGHLHLNNWTNKSGPGCGTLDMAPIFKAMGDSGYYQKPAQFLRYPRWMSVEFFDFLSRPVPEEEVISIAQRSMDCIMEHQHLWMPGES
ncbi:MAG: TIM barrel protein, partial [Candidatus Margulisiibacteriota bacterium]